MSVPASIPESKCPSSTVLAWPLHPACEAWPEMPPKELQALADDIEVNGLRDPLTITTDGELLDGRNRALACVMAGVTPTFTTYAGSDPWEFSASRNKFRRHLSDSQLAMVAARWVTTSQGGDRRSEDFKTADEGLNVKEAAKKVGVTKTAVEAARVVVLHGTVEEQQEVDSGAKKVRKASAQIRDRRRALSPPAAPLKPKVIKAPADPYKAVASDIVSKFSGDGQFRTVSKIALPLKVADAAAREALKLLGDAVDQRKVDKVAEYRIRSKEEALLIAKNSEIDRLKARIVDLEATLAARDAEIKQLKGPTGAPSSDAPALAMVH
jgi:hypothetical protein